jgi:hypothetical protein
VSQFHEAKSYQSANRLEMTVSGDEQGPCVASRQRQEKVILEPTQAYLFVVPNISGKSRPALYQHCRHDGGSMGTNCPTGRPMTLRGRFDTPVRVR